MRTLAFILLFLLVSSLSVAHEPGAETGVPVISDTEQFSEYFSISSKNPGYLATETVQPAIPSPMRALRNKQQHERQQRVGYEGPDTGPGQHFSLVESYRTKSVASLLVQGRQAALPAHNADYLRFGILVI